MLVIFDCDGVLVDSERLAADVFSLTLRSAGISLTPDECFDRFRGFTLGQCFSDIERQYGSPLPSAFDRQLSEATKEAFRLNLRSTSGVEDVLRCLSSNQIPFCLASNGSYAKIQHSLEVTGLWPLFDGKCFSAQAVVTGKPAPDLFLLAARTLAAPAGSCTVIEDSPAGVAAALAAGMRVLHYGGPPGGSGDRRVRSFASMVEVPALLNIAWPPAT